MKKLLFIAYAAIIQDVVYLRRFFQYLHVTVVQMKSQYSIVVV